METRRKTHARRVERRRDRGREKNLNLFEKKKSDGYQFFAFNTSDQCMLQVPMITRERNRRGWIVFIYNVYNIYRTP